MMKTIAHRQLLWLWLVLAPMIATAQGGSAAILLAKFQASQPQLQRNVFGRPMVLQSVEAHDQVSGSVHAVIDHPFAYVSNSLREPAVWCEILMLHLNTKHCAVREISGAAALAVAIGRTYDQPLPDAQRIDFAWRSAAITSDYLAVHLSATQGPFSTRDYRMELEAIPLDGGKTFVHLAYAYADGIVARLAMQIYLATIGSGKVGFTVIGENSAGRPEYVGGVRGVVERNTMRYYLAIDAYLNAPGDQQLEERLVRWFDSTEKYSHQLREMSRDRYLAMKREEFARMKAAR
ncbi:MULTISPECIES: hypothetical protein [unclassified Variovorax]|uniref:hypothetical protein n=1 Tax=unclassified Variovorax TaxID=663243 RepID=UPI0008399567|nr:MULTISPECIES: hypothetical protein [unclassified Variovorax]PNG48920.1 hypothetical protein CHC07_06710 [Variovorax sp. B4]PNG49776.1 hypothetical protein CHC06_05357 [Variovorax sp. B2]PNG50623.1 hypothetical protein CHC06_06247 [Variovorax sp. B2]VTV17816.1 hypothetical protein WDL1P1_00682 [Variovorax sp. WDL1]VTV18507.1 hypothetical protein WDL1P2_00209 [Variovorax sp. WDL1]